MQDAIEWEDNYSHLCSEENSVMITESNTSAIFVETEHFSGRHNVSFSEYWGPQLNERGIYDCPNGTQIECEPPWIDVVIEHFVKHYGGRDFEYDG